MTDGEDSLEDGQVSDDSSPGDGPVYCICRKSDTSRFMIGCDSCEEWFHGDCISISADYAKKILHFYCLTCRASNPDLQIIFKEKKSSRKKPLLSESNRIESKRSYEADDSDYEPETKPSKRVKYRESDEEEEEERKPRVTKKASAKGKNQRKGTASRGAAARDTRKSKRKEGDAAAAGATSGGGRRQRRSKDQLEEKEGPKQCYGPGCTSAARKASKYCSEDCGLKLAAHRIYEILPNRIRQWQKSPSSADELNREALEKVQQEQTDARNKLTVLSQEQEALEQLIQRSRETEPFSPEEEERALEAQAESDADLNMFCVTCGHEVPNKVVLRHMERCFSRYEAQSSLGSFYKTKIDNLFCDVYNSHQKTYCKRLRVLCPEHSKDVKIGDQEVCGFPLVINAFEETGSFCRHLKKKCLNHFNWEKIRRALIDMERVQQWLRVDELYEKEQRLRQAIDSRGGVLSLMLHQTISPDDLDIED